MTAPITIDQMREKLRPLDEVRQILAASEPLSSHEFTIDPTIRFQLDPSWNHGLDARDGTEIVNASVSFGADPYIQQFPLTKDALLEATSICGLSKSYVSRCPAELVEPQLNFWFREGLLGKTVGPRDFQLLVTSGVGSAITRATIRPFSNLRLLDEAVRGIEDKFGKGEILVDYKFTHSLRRTHLRLILPDQMRNIERSGTPDDFWSVGLQIRNSLIGAEQTRIDGYLFRWVCTNGAIDTRATSGAWSRRGHSTDDEVYEWARSTVDEVLGGLEPSLDAVQGMVDIPIEGEANEVLRDVFTHYRVPLPERARIIENMVESDQLTMYGLMAAVTQAANDPNLDPSHVESLLRLGGDLPHASTSRCDACRRLMPH